MVRLVYVTKFQQKAQAKTKHSYVNLKKYISQRPNVTNLCKNHKRRLDWEERLTLSGRSFSCCYRCCCCCCCCSCCRLCCSCCKNSEGGTGQQRHLGRWIITVLVFAHHSSKMILKQKTEQKQTKRIQSAVLLLFNAKAEEPFWREKSICQ